MGFIEGYTHWALHGECSSSHANLNNESRREERRQYHDMGILLHDVLMGDQSYTPRGDEPNVIAAIILS